jgi:hypothetical protein
LRHTTISALYERVPNTPAITLRPTAGEKPKRELLQRTHLKNRPDASITPLLV